MGRDICRAPIDAGQPPRVETGTGLRLGITWLVVAAGTNPCDISLQKSGEARKSCLPDSEIGFCDHLRAFDR